MTEPQPPAAPVEPTAEFVPPSTGAVAAPVAPEVEYVPFGSDKPPFYKRTDVLIVFAAVGVLVAVGVGAFALTQGAQKSKPAAATGVPAPQKPTLALTTTTAVQPPAPVVPLPPIAPSTTTTTVAPTTVAAPVPPPAAKPSVAPTTTTTSTTSAPPPPAPTASSGRFSGVVLEKNGENWVITDWEGKRIPVKVTPDTRFNAKPLLLQHDQFAIGQTIQVFWIDLGRGKQAESIYGTG